MSQPYDAKAHDKAIDQALEILPESSEERINLYGLFETRIEAIRSRLWSMLAFLAGAQGALIFFVVNNIELWPKDKPWLYAKNSLLSLVATLCVLLLALFMRRVMNKGTEHIERNFRRSDMALKIDPPFAIRDPAERRKEHPIVNVMDWIAFLSELAVAPLTLLSLYSLGWDIKIEQLLRSMLPTCLHLG